MTVFCVLKDASKRCIEATDLLSIFSTKEKAFKYIEEFYPYSRARLRVQEWIVDSIHSEVVD